VKSVRVAIFIAAGLAAAGVFLIAWGSPASQHGREGLADLGGSVHAVTAEAAAIPGVSIPSESSGIERDSTQRQALGEQRCEELRDTPPVVPSVDSESVVLNDSAPHSLRRLLQVGGVQLPITISGRQHAQLLEILAQYKQVSQMNGEKSRKSAHALLKEKEKLGDYELVPIASSAGMANIPKRSPFEHQIVQNRGGASLYVFRFDESDGGEVGQLAAERKALEVGTISQMLTVIK
jgi:hypothetical protein